MAQDPEIRVVDGHYSVKIYFGGVLHVRLPRGSIAVQSWRDGPTHFSIQFQLPDGRQMTCEYDTQDKWKAILAGLDKALP